MRQTITALDPDLPLQMFGPVPQVIEKFTSGTMMIGTVLFVFAALGLFLAAIGLYGVIANLVVQRTPEIGLRMALGAQPRDITRLILGTGIRLTLFGTAVGLIGSYGISRALTALNPAIASSPGLVKYDTPLVLLGGVLLLFIAASLACWLPARRATRVNPLEALRAE
jgi:ABC-type antimicrobial peptide transport system permease subunit